MSCRILLIGCGKSKAAEECAAADLYTGNLFAARRAYAERAGHPWWIVSAGHGLVDPDQLLRPYEARLAGEPEVERAAWALTVAHQLLDEFEDDVRLREVVVELHAGADYAEPLRYVLAAIGVEVVCPVEGLGIGEQLAWYREALAAGPLPQEAR